MWTAMLVGVLLIATVPASEGAVALETSAVTIEGSQETALLVAVPETAALPQEVPSFVEVALEASLPVGTELEIWVRSDPEVLPWTVGETLPVANWVTDARTGNLIRFDVTELVREWIDSSTQPAELLVRCLAEESEMPPSLDPSSVSADLSWLP